MTKPLSSYRSIQFRIRSYRIECQHCCVTVRVPKPFIMFCARCQGDADRPGMVCHVCGGLVTQRGCR